MFYLLLLTLLGIHIVQMTSLRGRPHLPSCFLPCILFYIPNPCILGTRPVPPCKNGSCCMLELVGCRVCLCYSTVAICLPLVAHSHTSKFDNCCAFLEKSVFYRYLTAAPVSLWLPTQFVHCCLVTARPFMPGSLIVILYPILELHKF